MNKKLVTLGMIVISGLLLGGCTVPGLNKIENGPTSTTSTSTTVPSPSPTSSPTSSSDPSLSSSPSSDTSDQAIQNDLNKVNTNSGADFSDLNNQVQ